MNWTHAIMIALQIVTIGSLYHHHTAEAHIIHNINQSAVPTLAELKVELNTLYKPKWLISQYLPFSEYARWERAKKQFLKYNDLRGIIKFKDGIANPELYYRLDSWIERARQRLWANTAKQ